MPGLTIFSIAFVLVLFVLVIATIVIAFAIAMLHPMS
jgi:hypothetical protein